MRPLGPRAQDLLSQELYSSPPPIHDLLKSSYHNSLQTKTHDRRQEHGSSKSILFNESEIGKVERLKSLENEELGFRQLERFDFETGLSWRTQLERSKLRDGREVENAGTYPRIDMNR